MSNKLFLSYSRKDAKWLERLQIQLSPLVREGLIDRWDDTRLAPGEEQLKEIDRALNEATAAVIFISSDYLATDFLQDVELPTLLRRAKEGGVRILPVIVRPCLFERSPLADFQPVNSLDKPLSALSEVEQEEVLLRVVHLLVPAMRSSETADQAVASKAREAVPLSPPLKAALEQLSATCGSVNIPVKTFNRLLVVIQLSHDYVEAVFDAVEPGKFQKIEAWLLNQSRKHVQSAGESRGSNCKIEDEKTVLVARGIAASEGCSAIDVRHFFMALLQDEESNTIRQIRKTLDTRVPGGFTRLRRAASELKPETLRVRSQVSSLRINEED